MNLLDSIQVAVEGLLANKMRSMLTMLGVIIGVGAVITMLAIATGARDRMMTNIQQMGTNVLMIRNGQSRQGAVRGGFGSNQTLTLDDAEAILDKCPSVEKVAPEAGGSAQVKYKNQNTNTSITGVTPDYASVRNFTIQDGKFFTERDVRSLKKVAVIGPTTASNLFGDESPVGKSIRIQGMMFKIVGETAPKGTGGFMDPDDIILIPITTAMRRVFGQQYLRNINVQARSMALMTQATNEIDAVLRKRHRIPEGEDPDFDIRSQEEIMQMAGQFSQIFTTLLGGIASVSLLVGGIGIMNIMLVSVTERTREIGIRMAIGARRSDIRFQFLVEALVISLLGGLIGVLMGLAGSWLMSMSPTWTVKVTLPPILLAFGFAALIGIFFGIYPAWKAAGLDPIDALRYE